MLECRNGIRNALKMRRPSGIGSSNLLSSTSKGSYSLSIYWPRNADFFIKKIKIRITRKIKECGVARNGVKELANYLM